MATFDVTIPCVIRRRKADPYDDLVYDTNRRDIRIDLTIDAGSYDEAKARLNDVLTEMLRAPPATGVTAP